jgi:hypothetical protein
MLLGPGVKRVCHLLRAARVLNHRRWPSWAQAKDHKIGQHFDVSARSESIVSSSLSPSPPESNPGSRRKRLQIPEKF